VPLDWAEKWAEKDGVTGKYEKSPCAGERAKGRKRGSKKVRAEGANQGKFSGDSGNYFGRDDFLFVGRGKSVGGRKRTSSKKRDRPRSKNSLDYLVVYGLRCT